MKTRISKALTITALAATALFSSASASAGLLTTPVQTQTFSFATLNDPVALLSFSGFNVSQGVLNSVHLSWTITSTVNNALINTNATASNVGTPVPTTATATTTFTGTGIATALSGSNNLTTPGFVGSVPGANAVTTVGTVSQTGVTGSTCISNDLSCSPSITNLTGYIGGANLFTISVSNFGNQGGSVPPGVFTGNNGTATGTVTLFYDYKIPAPATLALLGLGLFGLVSMRRKANA
ncbi:MAG: choice-of-anchor E domain-containing protein [Gallionella sp.]|nr:choice-of-anchor E domain-containing protein [Gallionella sp.]MDD4946779.1 choice-of-anchor E domain-containing protein [Gallionella sp.]MDD5613284.1 choice-of-anchor E domain-containing protein [Gallionella sp.]